MNANRGTGVLAGALLRLYLILGRCLDLPTHDHLPRASLGFFAIPQPHRPVQNLHPQRAFRAVAQRDGLPRLPGCCSAHWSTRTAGAGA
ncbi:MAG: hypothetical protein IPL99_13400 [Candidatus Competibacteraceae bacterium]|nr:hypothetical protein [Candidatus Competibacteraceae bacterium]